jgi:chromosome segregation ATPase
MSDEPVQRAREQIEALRRERDQLAEQIRSSQETIARSQELLKAIDVALAKAGHAAPAPEGSGQAKQSIPIDQLNASNDD